MQLFGLNRAGSLLLTVRNEDGEPVPPSAAPTVVVRDLDGTTVGSGTSTAYGPSSDHAYSYALPSGARGTLGVYEATWTFTVGGVSSSVVQGFEVVGALLFEIEDLRDAYPELSNANRYPAAAIRAARDEATERLETAAAVAFATRRHEVYLSGDGTSRLILPHVMVQGIVSVDIYGDDTGADTIDDAFDATQLADVEVQGEAGVLIRTDDLWPVGTGNVAVVYDHGYEYVPAAVKRAAMRLAVEALIPSGMPTRALSQSTELGEVRFSVANPEAGRPTGDPEVDAVIATYGRRRPSVG